MGFQAQGNGLHFRRGPAFKIQRDSNPRAQRVHIAIANMAAVFAQMRRDAICARRLGQKGRAQRVGPRAATRVAQGCHVVNIHPKTQFRCCHGCPLPLHFRGAV